MIKVSFMRFCAMAVAVREHRRPPLTKNRLLKFGRNLSLCVGTAS